MGSRNGVWVRVDRPFHQTDHDLEGARHQASVYWGRSLSFCQGVEEPGAHLWVWLETVAPEIQF